MKVIIRTDASVKIGSGHVIRCLTIAKSLKSNGCEVLFWMEPLEGNLIDYIEQQGFFNITAAEPADLYIIDHYELNKEWEQYIRTYTRKLVVIDDVARVHDCDLLLDQNVVQDFEKRYIGRVPNDCIKLLGTRYLIMREEFIQARSNLRIRDKNIQRLLVFMGGSDPTDETLKILHALKWKHFMHVDIVVGNSNPNKLKIEHICNQRGYYYHCQIDYMAELMQFADFAIGAGGSTLWERCYVGLPSSSTIVADNQKDATLYAAKLGVTINLGWHEHVTVETYMQLLSKMNVRDMSEKCLELTMTERPNTWLYELLELIK